MNAEKNLPCNSVELRRRSYKLGMNVVYVVERKNWNEQSFSRYKKSPIHSRTHWMTEWINASNEKRQNKMKTNQNLFNPKYFCIHFTSFSFTYVLVFAFFSFAFDAIWTMQFSFRRNRNTQIYCIAFNRFRCTQKKQLVHTMTTNRDKCSFDVHACVCECSKRFSNYKWTNVVTKSWFTSIHMSLCVQ